MELFQNNIVFPENIYLDKFDIWNIDLDNPYNNIIQLEGTDFIINYLDSETKSNKGGNSYIFTLHTAQEFEEKGYEEPVLVLKISKTWLRKRKKIKSTLRFENEVKALIECNKQNFSNVVKIFHSGKCQVLKKRDKSSSLKPTFYFYTMEFAEYDLKKFIEDINPDIYERINLCLEIANGLKELNQMGFYHRDIKPDNIFISEGTWKIGDLGLVDNRTGDYNVDNSNELIGPRGWYCPESMNKFLTEDKGFDHIYDCKIDHQSDIFQLGKVFWYILQGNAPIGCIKPNDFKIKDMKLYSIIRTMLNHSKKKRYIKIDEVIKLLSPIYDNYYRN